MNCPKCGGDTRVVESRPREGGVWRRRKCAKAHLSYTLETPTAEPLKKIKPSLKKPKPKTAKPKPVPKPKEIPYSPAVEEWNLKVTASSPLWLKSMALKLG
jgi:rRNA maturation protein Nop10